MLVTHMHPDHVGLAHWLCERWNAPLWMSGTDYQTARYACQVVNSFGGERLADYFFSHGMTDPADLEQIRNRKSYYRGLVPALPPSYARLMDGATVTIGGLAWRCIAGYGHAPEHMALYSEQLNILISGDMVLPRISTNVSVYEMEPEADSLTLFLDSIDRFAPLPPDTLVLLSHGKPFTGLHTRASSNCTTFHHELRLATGDGGGPRKAGQRLRRAARAGQRPRSAPNLPFALGEAVAHFAAARASCGASAMRTASGALRRPNFKPNRPPALDGQAQPSSKFCVQETSP